MGPRAGMPLSAMMTRRRPQPVLFESVFENILRSGSVGWMEAKDRESCWTAAVVRGMIRFRRARGEADVVDAYLRRLFDWGGPGLGVERESRGREGEGEIGDGSTRYRHGGLRMD